METYSYLEQFPLKGNGVIVISALTPLQSRQSTEDYTTERSSALGASTDPSSPLLIPTIPQFPFSLKLEAGREAGGEKQCNSLTSNTITPVLYSPSQGQMTIPCSPFPKELLFMVARRKSRVISAQPQGWKTQAWVIPIRQIQRVHLINALNWTFLQEKQICQGNGLLNLCNEKLSCTVVAVTPPIWFQGLMLN